MSVIFLLVFHICLMSMKANVFAENNHNAGFSYTTFTDNDICSDIFNLNQCEYMKQIMNVFLDKFEREKLNFEAEKSIFVDQIKQIKQEVKLLKKQLKHTIDKQDDKIDRILEHCNTQHTTKNDETFSNKYTKNVNMEGEIKNMTSVRY